MIDRLLASPHYGERWGRHWLDLAHYADTAGETADFPVPEAYKYRNYVIDSFNADKPYDEFIREQIAGDLLAADGPPEKRSERIIATGFIAVSRRFGFDPQNYHHLTIEDTIDTLGKSVLGLTVACAAATITSSIRSREPIIMPSTASSTARATPFPDRKSPRNRTTSCSWVRTNGPTPSPTEAAARMPASICAAIRSNSVPKCRGVSWKSWAARRWRKEARAAADWNWRSG